MKDPEKWETDLHELASLYSEIERRSLSISTFSFMPFVIYLWATIKFTLWFYLDILIFIPMNLAIFIRNLFPGRWRYRFFSGVYFKRVAQWIWSGEIPVVAMVAMRSITYAFLRMHFRNRLELIQRSIRIEENLPEEQEKKLLDVVDKMLLRWPPWKLPQLLLTYGLPILSPIVGLYQLVLPGSPPVWTGFVILMSLSWALAFVASGFLIKRGLMLGGNARLAYFPGFLTGRGAYAIEEKILEDFGVARKEFPLGFVLSLLLIPVGFLQALSMYDTGIYHAMSGEQAFSKEIYLAQSMTVSILIAILGFVALARRSRLGRS